MSESGSGHGSGSDQVCPKRLDPVWPEKLDPDPVNIRLGPKPWLKTRFTYKFCGKKCRFFLEIRDFYAPNIFTNPEQKKVGRLQLINTPRN